MFDDWIRVNFVIAEQSTFSLRDLRVQNDNTCIYDSLRSTHLILKILTCDSNETVIWYPMAYFIPAVEAKSKNRNRHKTNQTKTENKTTFLLLQKENKSLINFWKADKRPLVIIMLETGCFGFSFRDYYFLFYFTEAG